MSLITFALSSSTLGVSPSLINLILILVVTVLIGLPAYFLARSKGAGQNSLANY
tara:strand:+ start:238 stop:399 length:162 start_codon:yes stop_codon:yes gene_type:complete